MENNLKKEITKEDFIEFFRNSEKLNTLSVSDRIEVFSTILLGTSDFKLRLFEEIFRDYGVTHLNIIETNNG